MEKEKKTNEVDLYRNLCENEIKESIRKIDWCKKDLEYYQERIKFYTEEIKRKKDRNKYI